MFLAHAAFALGGVLEQVLQGAWLLLRASLLLTPSLEPQVNINYIRVLYTSDLAELFLGGTSTTFFVENKEFGIVSILSVISAESLEHPVGVVHVSLLHIIFHVVEVPQEVVLLGSCPALSILQMSCLCNRVCKWIVAEVAAEFVDDRQIVNINWAPLSWNVQPLLQLSAFPI